jgi:multiple sugar transport system substrate-binding protein
MNEQEMMRVLDFIGRSRALLASSIGGLGPDADWAIVSHLVRAHLLKQRMTITELIRVSGLPYGTATRRIQKMIADGAIERVSTERGASWYDLAASAELRRAAEGLVQQTKILLAQTLGMRDDWTSDEDYFFGEARAHMAEMLPPRSLMPSGPGGIAAQGLKFLFHDDNYFASLRNLWVDIRSSAGKGGDFQLASLPQLYEMLLANAARPVSEFDVVTLNLPWVPELISKEIIAPMDPHVEPDDMKCLHPAIWNSGLWNGQRAGFPLYVTVEALAARKDLFEAGNLRFPRTPAEVLKTARRLHRPKDGIAGVSWNGARGVPIASAFMFFLGDHRGSVVTPSSHPSAPGWRAALTTDAAAATLGFMRELLEVSPDDVLTFDGDRTMYEFMAGRSSMAYVWSMRAARFEFDLQSRVRGHVQYLPHPNLNGTQRVVPIGGFLLAIPANLPKERAVLAAQAIRWMTSAGARASHVQNGLPLVPEFGVGSDTELDATSPIVSFVKTLARDNLLDLSMRPVIPVYHWIESILGEEIHDALSGIRDDATALERANLRIQAFLDRMN